MEETGWRPGTLHHLLTVETSGGFSDARHHVCWADGGEQVGPPVNDVESERIDWVPLDTTPDLIAQGDIQAANTVAALLMLRHIRGPR